MEIGVSALYQGMPTGLFGIFYPIVSIVYPVDEK